MRFALVMLCFEGRNSDSAVHHFARGFGEGCEEAEKVRMDRTQMQMVLILILFVLKLTYNLFGKNRRGGIYEFLVLFLIIVISYKAMAFVYSGFG